MDNLSVSGSNMKPDFKLVSNLEPSWQTTFLDTYLAAKVIIIMHHEASNN